MSKTAYIKQLRTALTGNFSENEVNDIIGDYNEYFETGIAEGKTEEELESEFGSPDAVAHELCKDRQLSSAIPARQAENNFFNGKNIFRIAMAFLFVVFFCFISLFSYNLNLFSVNDYIFTLILPILLAFSGAHLLMRFRAKKLLFVLIAASCIFILLFIKIFDVRLGFNDSAFQLAFCIVPTLLMSLILFIICPRIDALHSKKVKAIIICAITAAFALSTAAILWRLSNIVLSIPSIIANHEVTNPEIAVLHTLNIFWYLIFLLLFFFTVWILFLSNTHPAFFSALFYIFGALMAFFNNRIILGNMNADFRKLPAQVYRSFTPFTLGIVLTVAAVILITIVQALRSRASKRM